MRRRGPDSDRAQAGRQRGPGGDVNGRNRAKRARFCCRLRAERAREPRYITGCIAHGGITARRGPVACMLRSCRTGGGAAGAAGPESQYGPASAAAAARRPASAPPRVRRGAGGGGGARRGQSSRCAGIPSRSEGEAFGAEGPAPCAPVRVHQAGPVLISPSPPVARSVRSASAAESRGGTRVVAVMLTAAVAVRACVQRRRQVEWLLRVLALHQPPPHTAPAAPAQARRTRHPF
jgi:hypothetical protein